MKFLRKWDFPNKPEITLILLDWSVRESFHTLEYLNRQRIDRSLYEIMWIEFYDRRSEKIDVLMRKHEKLGLPAPIDTWILMETPQEQYYHKHQMYNVGILNSASRNIIAIVDSDTITRTTFVETILEAYRKKNNHVLHFEQIRNFDHKYYPFNFPSIDEINGPGCVNAVDGVPIGFNGQAKSLKENWNLWHVYNYGACFCAKRDDIIHIGGADEHVDYLGHICGPYEMTARLVNAGVRDELHPTHFLYHVWHPNTGGDNNYCGPNNGRGMSTTAMKIPETGRIMPLLENAEIKKLRLSQM